MKVIIKITKNGYSKTVKNKDGTQISEKRERSGNGFSQTEGSIEFNETNKLLPETIEALSCDFQLMSISDALETESAEFFGSEAPVTDDGHLLQRGEEFFTVACTNRNKKLVYIPLRLKYPQDWGSQGSTSYFSKEKCITECDSRNAIK